MARRTATPDPDMAALAADTTMPGLGGLTADPAPKRRPGRPKGSTNRATTAKIGTRNSRGQIMSKAQLIAKVEAEAYAFFSLMVATWEFRDPCAAVMHERVTLSTPGGPVDTDRLQALVAKFVEILSRSDKALAFAASTGMIGSLLETGMLVLPIARTLWEAHGPGGHAHQLDQLGVPADEFAHRYPAPA